MATKNQIAQTTWIMETMQIIGAKSHKQNCLEQTEQYRIRIVPPGGEPPVSGFCRDLTPSAATIWQHFFMTHRKRANWICLGQLALFVF